MRRPHLAGLLFLFLCGSAAAPADAFCERCQTYFGWFGDEFLVYEVCTATDFPRSGFVNCQSDEQPLGYGGYCLESGSLCRWASLDDSSLEASPACVVPVPGTCAWSA